LDLSLERRGRESKKKLGHHVQGPLRKGEVSFAVFETGERIGMKKRELPKL